MWQSALTFSVFASACAGVVSVCPKRSGALCNMNLKGSGEGGPGARGHLGRGIGPVRGEISQSAPGEMRADKEIIQWWQERKWVS